MLPTDEEMTVVAKEWWARQADVSFHAWNDVLKKHSLDMRIVPLPVSLIHSTLELSDGGREQKLPAVILSFAELIRQPLIKMDCSDYFFCKLISRSPKDWLADDNDYGKPRPLHNVNELIDSLCCSMRTFDDMVLLRYLPDVAALVLRPYVEFSASDEWRVFVLDGKIVGITQYYYATRFPDLTPEKVIAVESRIRSFQDEIVSPNMNTKTFVVDYLTDGDEIKILETNPYGLSDPCLFESYENLDGTIRWVQ